MGLVGSTAGWGWLDVLRWMGLVGCIDGISSAELVGWT